MKCDNALLPKDAKSFNDWVGAVVEDLRKEKGFTRAKLAQAIGTAQSTIYYIETGRHALTVYNLIRLTEVFECEFQDIIPLVIKGDVNMTYEGRIAALEEKNKQLKVKCQQLENKIKRVKKIIE